MPYPVNLLKTAVEGEVKTMRNSYLKKSRQRAQFSDFAQSIGKILRKFGIKKDLFSGMRMYETKSFSM